MTPTIVTKDGKLALVLGTPGGPTIINTVLQVLLNVIDFGMNVQDAVDFPRIHHQWLPDQLLHGTQLLARHRRPAESPRPQRRNWPAPSAKSPPFRCDGEWIEGAADPRTEGVAKGY